MSGKGWPSPTAASPPSDPLRPEPVRFVSDDHPDRRLIVGRHLIAPLYLRIDETQLLPVEVYEGRGVVVARFRTAYEAAAYCDARRPGRPIERLTLPLPIVEAWERLVAADEAHMDDSLAALRRGGAL